ncbi:MAG: aminopeptidase P family protein, partial [Clostridia bacterium]|nr:aminopeptidase P family protein [Clostridia bacterium]
MLGREALRALKSQRKAQKFKAMINEKELYLITDEKQRLYYTGYQSTDGYLLLGRGFSYFVIDSRYFHAANKLLSKKGVNVILGSGYSALKDIMYKTGCDTLGIDFTKTSLHEYKIFEEAGYKLKDISKEIADAMRVKSPADLRKIKKACKIAQTALKQLLPEIKEGVRERELAASLEYKMKMLGASGPSFETIVAFGANAAIPHHVTG